MSDRIIKWGILGAARVNERLLPAIVEAKHSKLMAIASRREGAAQQTLDKYLPSAYDQVRVYNQLDELLANPEIDAVYIPLANHEHAEWTLKALNDGKHVLCEKPMALKASDIEAIANAAAKNNKKVMEGFMYRFHPQHERVMEIIRSGLIGDIISVRSCFSFMMRPARMYRLTENISNGGGAMWDIGCYAIHALRQFFEGIPESLFAMAKYVESGADITTSGLVNFGNGKFAQFDFSFERARRCEYEIIGTKGGVKCHIVWQLPGDVPVISWWTEDGKQCEERLPASNHFTLEIDHFNDCILNDLQPKLSLEDARTNCLIIEAAIKSMQTGSLVKLK